MTTAAPKRRTSLAKLKLYQAIFEAAEYFDERIEKLSPRQEQALQDWLTWGDYEPRSSYKCEDTESIEPFAVLCTSCSRFKAYHLWPCFNFQTEPFVWLVLQDGEVITSEDEDAYFWHPYVRGLVTLKHDYLKTRAFFEPELEGKL